MPQILEAIVVLKIGFDPDKTENPHSWNWNKVLNMGNDEYANVIACEGIAQPE